MLTTRAGKLQKIMSVEAVSKIKETAQLVLRTNTFSACGGAGGVRLSRQFVFKTGTANMAAPAPRSNTRRREQGSGHHQRQRLQG